MVNHAHAERKIKLDETKVNLENERKRIEKERKDAEANLKQQQLLRYLIYFECDDHY